MVYPIRRGISVLYDLLFHTNSSTLANPLANPTTWSYLHGAHESLRKHVL